MGVGSEREGGWEREKKRGSQGGREDGGRE